MGIDYVILQKWTANEPTWSSIGTAQSTPYVYTSQVGNIKIQ